MQQSKLNWLSSLLHSPTAFSWFELSWPKDLDSEQVRAWLLAISGNPISKGLRFITLAQKDSIKHFVVIPSHNETRIVAAFASFLPSVEVISCEPVKPKVKIAAKIRMTSKQRILNTTHPDIVSFAILTALQNLSKNECLTLMWTLGNSRSPAAIPTTTTSFSAGSFFGSLLEAMSGGIPHKLDQVALTSMRKKHEIASWDAMLFIGISTKSKKRRDQLLNRILGSLKVAEAPGVRLGKQLTSAKRFSVAYTPLFWPLSVSVDEFLGLLGWPLGNRTVAGLERVLYRRLPLPEPVSSNGIELADSVFTNDPDKLVLLQKDRFTHMEILGPTSSGKSTLMLQMMLQDATNGFGFAFVDFKGDLVRSFLERVPDHRIPDVVTMDLSNSKAVVGLNPLAKPGENASLVADNILSIFKNLYGSSIGPRSADLLYCSLLTLMQVPGMSLNDLPLLFTSPAFRQQLITKITSPLLRNFWISFEHRTPADQNQIIMPLENKLRPFLLRPSIRNMLSQRDPKFEIADVFNDKRKILLVNLSKSSIGSEAARLFAAFVITKILQEIRQRAALPPSRRLPAFLYIDEVQEYWRTSDDFNEALETFRSNNVAITFAHQYLGQLSKDKQQGLTNARNKVCFQLSHDDAMVMSRSSSILTPEDFESLPLYHIYAQIVRNGIVLPWTSGVTKELIEPIHDPNHITTLSLQQYGVPVNEIENQSHSVLPSLSPTDKLTNTTPIGRKKVAIKKHDNDPLTGDSK